MKQELYENSSIVKSRFWDCSEIRKQLRDAVNFLESRPIDTGRPCSNEDIHVVVSERATGKTTGLVYFVGERTLVNYSDSKKSPIAVITPNDNISRIFSEEFKTHFPTLPEPYMISYQKLENRLAGSNFTEIYIEEVFLIDRLHLRCLYSNRYPIVVGVGTIQRPTTVSLKL